MRTAQFLKVIFIPLVFLQVVRETSFCCDDVFSDNKADPKNGKLIVLGFANEVPAAILSRGDQTTIQLTGPTGLTKPAFTVSEHVSTESLFAHIDNIGSSHLAISGTKAHTLFALHCLLTI